MATKPAGHYLTLIASGETTWSREGRLLGSADLPLSNEGLSQATRDAEALAGELGLQEKSPSPPFSVIHHPPDEAATATAQTIAARLNSKTKAVDDLREPHLGLLEGLTEQTFAERYPKRKKQFNDDPLSMSPPEGENLLDARNRLFAAVVRLIQKKGKRGKSGEVAIVLHHLNLGLLRCWFSDVDPSRLWELIAERPRVERYFIPPDQLQRLADIASEEGASA